MPFKPATRAFALASAGVRAALLAGVTLVALLCPFFSIVMSLIGAVFSMSISIVLPCLFYYKLCRPGRRGAALCVAIAAFGVAAGTTATADAFRSLAGKYRRPPAARRRRPPQQQRAPPSLDHGGSSEPQTNQPPRGARARCRRRAARRPRRGAPASHGPLPQRALRKRARPIALPGTQRCAPNHGSVVAPDPVCPPCYGAGRPPWAPALRRQRAAAAAAAAAPGVRGARCCLRPPPPPPRRQSSKLHDSSAGGALVHEALCASEEQCPCGGARPRCGPQRDI